MRKTALTLTVSTLVLSVFGAFLHWLQTMNAFEKETGFPVPGAGTTVVFLIYSVLAIALFCVVTIYWLGRFERGTDAAVALRCETVIPQVAGWALCAVFAAASFYQLFTAAHSDYPLWQRLFGAFGIVAALSFPFLFGKKGGSGAGAAGRGAAVLITLFSCYWMVFTYKLESQEPIIWKYALEILAVAAATVAFYEIAAFFFGKGHVRRTLIAAAIGIYFCVTALFEERSTVVNAMLGVTAALLLVLEFLLIANMSETHNEE